MASVADIWKKHKEEYGIEVKPVDYNVYAPTWDEHREMAKVAQASAAPAGPSLPKEEPSITERFIKTLSGAGKSYGASFANIPGVLADTAGTANDLAFGEQHNKAVEQAKKNIEAYKAKLAGTGLTPDMRKRIEDAIASNQRTIDVLTGQKQAQRQNADAVRDKVYQATDKLSDSAAYDIARAKQGLGGVGQLAVDVGVGGTQLAGDIGLALATGGSSLLPMAVRSFGGATQEARQEGANLGQQLAYGAGSAALSTGTEKMFGGSAIAQKAFGGGVLDKVANEAFKPLAGKAVGRVAKSMVEEGAEEATESLINPLLKKATYDRDAGWNGKEIVNDALVGAILGGAMGGLSESGPAFHKAGAAIREAGTAIREKMPGRKHFRAAVNAPATENVPATPTDAPVVDEPPVSVENVPASRVEQVVEIAKQGDLSNKYAEALMEDPEAVAELGLDLTDLTKSQARAAIKSAIMERVYADEAVLEDSVEPATDTNVGTTEPAATPQNPLQVEKPAPAPEPEKVAKPVKQVVAEPAKPVGAVGKKGVTHIDSEHPLNFHYEVRPAETLTTSNDAYGVVNKAYPQELQPRNRDRANYLRQMARIASKPLPNWLADSHHAQDGAPIVRSDGVVIGGNGRVAGLTAAYEKGNADGYAQYLRDNAEQFGLDPNAIPERPVLIRVLDDDIADLPKLASDLNVSDMAMPSATEMAIDDASRLTPDILALLQVDEDGDLLGTDNKAFIQAFNSEVVPQSQEGSTTMSDGKLSKTGLNRITNAVLYYAYRDASLVEALAEDPSPDSRNIINALVSTAPAAVMVRSGVDAGDLYDVGVIPTVLNAVDLYQKARAEKLHAVDYAAQDGLFGSDTQYDYYETRIAEFIEQNTRGAKQLKTLLNAIYQQVLNAGNPNETGLFEVEDPTLEGVMEGAINEYEKESKRKFPAEGSGGSIGEYGGGAKEKSDRSRSDYGPSGPAESGGNQSADSGRAEPVTSTDPIVNAARAMKQDTGDTLTVEVPPEVLEGGPPRKQKAMPMEKDDGDTLTAEVPPEVLEGNEPEAEQRKNPVWPDVKPGQRISNNMTQSLEYERVGGKATTGMDEKTYNQLFVYKVLPEAESLAHAHDTVYNPDGTYRGDTDPEGFSAFKKELADHPAWNAPMTDAAYMILDEMRKKVLAKQMTQKEYMEWDSVIDGHNRSGGQGTQAIAKHTNRSGAISEKEAWDTIQGNPNLTEEEKGNIFGEVLENDSKTTELMERIKELEAELESLKGRSDSTDGSATPEHPSAPATDGDGNTPSEGNPDTAEPATDDRTYESVKEELEKLKEEGEADLKKRILDIAQQRKVLKGKSGKLTGRLGRKVSKAMDGMDIDTLAKMAYASSKALVSDSKPRDIGQILKAIQVMNMLSSPKTPMKNITGNASFYGLDALTMNGAAILDSVIAKKTGTRSIAKEASVRDKQMRKAIGKAINDSIVEVTLDIDMGGGDRYQRGGHRTFRASGNPIERLFSTFERNLGYLMTTTDEAFKGAARYNENATQKLIDEEKIKNAPEDYAKAQAEELAKYRTFQRDGKLAAAIQAVHDVLNLVGIGDAGKRMGKGGKYKVHSFGLGDLVAPFTRIAGNLGGVGVDYSPVKMVQGTAEILRVLADYEANPAKQAKAVSDFARGMSGTAVAFGVAMLAKAGLIKRADDEDDEDVADLNRAEGMTGTQVNISALDRVFWGKGTAEWREGDTLLDVSNLEPINFIISLGEDIAKDNPDDSALSTFGSTAGPEGWMKTAYNAAKTAGELPILSTVGDYAKSVTSYGNDPIATAAEMLTKTAVSSVTPNAMAAVAKGIDPLMRTTTSHRDKDRPWASAAYNVADYTQARIPKVREGLPEVKDVMGRTKQGSGFINAVINPFGVNKYTQSKESREMKRIKEQTGNGDFYMSTRPVKELSYTDERGQHKKVLTAKEQARFQSSLATAHMSMTSAVMKTRDYKSATPDKKAAYLDLARRYAYQTAKAGVMGADSADGWVENSKHAQRDLGVSQAEWLCMYDKYGSDLMGGQSYDKTVRMYKAGVTIDRWQKMKTALKDHQKKAEVIAYIDGHFAQSKRHDIYAAYCPSDPNNPY